MSTTARVHTSSSLSAIAGSFALLAVLTPRAHAQEVVQEVTPDVGTARVESRLIETEDTLPISVGVMADVGVPDGFVGSVGLRAYDRFEVYLGGGHNSMSPGVRAGLRAAALTGPVSPYAALEGGHYFRGQASAWVQGLATSAGLDESIEVDQVGYSYGNAHLGLRLGGQRTAFYIQGGMSVVRIDATIRGDSLPDMAPVGPDGTMTVPTISKWTPSGRVGMVAFF